MINYDKLSNREIEKLRKQYFGNVLKTTKEIGRDAVIEELRKWDALLIMRQKYSGFVVATTKKREKEFKEVERYVLWVTSDIKEYISLREFMRYK